MRARIEALGVAMPGPRLNDRIGQIVSCGVAPRISRARAAGITAACAAVFAVFVAGTLTRAQSSSADWEKAAGGKMSFDVASVKRNMTCHANTAVYTRETIPESNIPLDAGDSYAQTGGLLITTRNPLNLVIAFAYKVPEYGPMTNPLPDAPKWTTSECFDINARGSANATKDQMRLMVQSLLADRFKLMVHWERKNAPVMVLSLVKTGKLGRGLSRDTDSTPCSPDWPTTTNPSFAKISGGYPAHCGAFFGMGGGGAGGFNLAARQMTMAQLGEYISTELALHFDRPVIDKTGLDGAFNMKLNYTIEALGTQAQSPDYQAALTQALKDELGLKLEPGTGLVDELVIDHIEEPTPN